jgi:hypothetical protein
MPLLDLTPVNGFATSRDKKNEQAVDGRLNLDERNLSSIESVHESISSLTHTVNSALAAFSLLMDDGEGFAQRLSRSDRKEQFQEYFLKMRKDYEEVAIISKSTAEFARLVVIRLDGNALTEIDVPQSTKDSPR